MSIKNKKKVREVPQPLDKKCRMNRKQYHCRSNQDYKNGDPIQNMDLKIMMN